MSNEHREEITLVITPSPQGKDLFGRTPAERLKSVLKRLLRSHGFRVVRMGRNSK
jgi:hypothetical protein